MPLNKYVGHGRLGKDPEVKVTESGIKVANFSIAIDDSYKGKDGKKVEQTEWVNIVIWGKLADVVEKYLKKGSEIIVEGKLKTRSYTDKEGNKRYITEVLAEKFTMVGGKQEGKQDTPSEPMVQDVVGDDEQDLPF